MTAWAISPSEFLAAASRPAGGCARGVVMDVPEVTTAIGEALEAAEQESGEQITSAYLGIAGNHIATSNSAGISPIDGRHGVTGNDMQRALEAARAVQIPANRQIIHVIAPPLEGGRAGEYPAAPLGILGSRLEVDAHIVTGTINAINNLAQCVLAHGIDIDELGPRTAGQRRGRTDRRRAADGRRHGRPGRRAPPIWPSFAAATGSGTPRCSTWGGSHMTNDVAIGLRAPL